MDLSTEALALVILSKGTQKNTCLLAELLSWVVKRLSDREAFYRQKNTEAHRGEQLLALNALAVTYLALSAPEHDWEAENADIDWFQYNEDQKNADKDKHEKDSSESEVSKAQQTFSDEFGEFDLGDDILLAMQLQAAPQTAPKRPTGCEYYTASTPSTRGSAPVRECVVSA